MKLTRVWAERLSGAVEPEMSSQEYGNFEIDKSLGTRSQEYGNLEIDKSLGGAVGQRMCLGSRCGDIY